MNSLLRILHLEDDPGDARLVQDTLKADGLNTATKVVDGRASFEAALKEGGFQVILADYLVPGFGGLDALALSREQRPEIPFILVTGALGEDSVVEMLRRGAIDIVFKDRLWRLGFALRRALRESAARTSGGTGPKEGFPAESEPSRSGRETPSMEEDKEYSSPSRSLIVLAGTLFVSEFAAMLILPLLPEMRVLTSYAVDALLMLCLGFPIIYAFAIRPLGQQIQHRRRAEQELRQHREQLEELVTLRTIELEKMNTQLRHTIAEQRRTEETLRESDEHVRQALDVGRMVAFHWDVGTDKVVRFCDGGILINAGVSPQGTGKEHFQRVDPNDRERVRALLDQLSPAADRYRTVYRMQGANGAVLSLEETGRGSFDARGQLVRVIGVTADITSREQTEDALRILNRAMEAGPASVVITDGQGAITYINPACTQMTGYSLEEVLGKTPRVWKSGQHPPEFYSRLWRVLDARLEWRGEFCNRKKTGELFWAYSSISPITDEGGGLTNFVAVFVDITKRKLYEQELEDARRQLELKVAERTADLERTVGDLSREIEARQRAEAEIEEFQRLRDEMARVSRITMAEHLSAALAHELRQPLGAILINTEAAQRFLLRQPPDLGEAQAALEDIIRDDEQASQIIQRLRALYRRTGHQRSPVDLNRVIGETLALLRSELILSHVSWHQKLAEALPPVQVDRVEMQQVLVNLILNARDAMKENPANSRVLTISSTLKTDSIGISVSDTGIGIGQEAMDRLGEPFFTTKPSGMGMGLAVSRAIIEAHGGRFSAANNPAGGATFQLTIPIVKEQPV